MVAGNGANQAYEYRPQIMATISTIILSNRFFVSFLDQPIRGFCHFDCMAAKGFRRGIVAKIKVRKFSFVLTSIEKICLYAALKPVTFPNQYCLPG